MLVLLLIISGLGWWIWGRGLVDFSWPGSDQTPDLENSLTNTVGAGQGLRYVAGMSEAAKDILKQTETYVAFLKIQNRCAAMTDKPAQQSCQADLELGQVLEVKDPTLCGQIEKQDDCYLSFASINSDSGFCAKVKDLTRQQTCIDNLAIKTGAIDYDDLSECQAMDDGYQRGICIMQVLKTATDLQFCEHEIIKNSSVKTYDSCRATIFTNQALAAKDKSLCEQITVEARKNNCLIYFP